MPAWTSGATDSAGVRTGVRSTNAAPSSRATAAIGAASAPGAQMTITSADGAAAAWPTAQTTSTNGKHRTVEDSILDPMSRALGRYELLRPLARGGMAEVFLARRRAAGVEKVLVIKRIRPERAADAGFLELFIKEARLSMSLAHQNIVPVFDFGRVDDQVYIAMERVEGKDLGSTLARGAKVSPLLAAF